MDFQKNSRSWHKRNPRKVWRATSKFDTSLFNPKTQPSTCYLLTRLPYELRLQIYHYVVGHETIHLLWSRKRLWNSVCPEPPISPSPCPWPLSSESSSAAPSTSDFCTCNYTLTGDLLAERFHSKPTSSTALSTLLSCKQIYLEALPVLYTTSTFDVTHLYTLIDLARVLSPTNLSMIRLLSLSWWLGVLSSDAKRRALFLPNDDQANDMWKSSQQDSTWAALWNVIAHDLTGLQGLDLHLTMKPPGSNGALGRLSIDQNWVAPMLQVQGLKRCTIVLWTDPTYPFDEEKFNLVETLEKRMCSQKDELDG